MLLHVLVFRAILHLLVIALLASFDGGLKLRQREHFGCTWTLGGVRAQHFLHKLDQRCRVRRVHGLVLSGYDALLKRFDAEAVESWVQVEQFIHDASNGPHVTLSIIFATAAEFWRHVQWRAALGLSHVSRVGKDLGKAKVTYANGSVRLADEYVLLGCASERGRA